MTNRRSFVTACISNAVRFAALLAFQAHVVVLSSAQTHIPLQPLAQQVRQVETALGYLGQPLSRADHKAINQSIADSDEASAVSRLEHILDHYTLAIVEINAESRVKVQ
jgi:hypothetical protein